MAETEVNVPPENKGKRRRKRGGRSKLRNSKISHPPPPSKEGVTADDTAHDPPVPSKEATSAIQKDMDKHEYASETTTSKKKAPKHCKFGKHCARKNCKYLHPAKQATPETSLPTESTTTDNVISKKNFSRDSDRQESPRPSKMAPQGRDDSPNDTPVDTIDQHVERKQKPAKNKRCFRGSKCNRLNCPYRHPQDTAVSPTKHDGQQQDTVTAVKSDVATLEAATETKATEIPLAADLEASLVAEAQQQQHSLTRSEAQQPEASQSQRRKKRDREIEMRRRRQEQEDRLMQEEEERLRLKQEEEELDRMLQDQERQRQAEAEAALVAEQARIEINRIRQDLAAEKEQARRFAQDPQRERVEREALERFKRAHEDEKKSEEVARRLQEEEQRLLDQQNKFIRRERENEMEFHRPAQDQGKERRHTQEDAKEGACHIEEAAKVQEADLRPDDTDEERERYKAERKAAKKERRRLEREAKMKRDVTSAKEPSMQSPEPKQEQSVSYAVSPTGSNQENVNDANTPDTAEDEADKKRRWQEELRRQKERAAEKKAQKQKLRRERMLQDVERQTQERTQFWQSEIADEMKTVDLLVQLCAAEFCRKNPGVDRQTLLADAGVKEKLEEAAHETFRAVCKAEIHNRVVVKGMKQQDLNDRTGTIQSWNESKKKFYVGLDTKKGKNTQYMYLLPENLEALPLPSPQKGKMRSDPVHVVSIASLFADTEFMVDVYKNEVDQMKKTASIDDFLEQLMLDRDREEREAKEQEEEDLRREERARKRRAEQRRRENEEWERRKREYAEQKAEYQEWCRQQRKANAGARARGGRDYFEEAEHPYHCQCPRCQFENCFYGSGMGGSGGGSGPRIFFSFGPDGPGIFFSFGDSDSDDDYEDQWDRQWEQMHEEELAQQNAEAAEVLGVEMEADEAEIKRVFRKKARKYHPDSYRAENHEDGMTKEEAEEHFKELSNAYDHLMSNFDDDDDDDYESE